MLVQAIKQTNQQTFQARVRLGNSGIGKALVKSGAVSTGAVSTTGSGAISTASNIVGMGSDVAGAAFSLKASNVDSSGIVPFIIERATPFVTPATIHSAEVQPSTMGSLLSTSGGFLHGSSTAKVTKVKDPS